MVVVVRPNRVSFPTRFALVPRQILVNVLHVLCQASFADKRTRALWALETTVLVFSPHVVAQPALAGKHQTTLGTHVSARPVPVKDFLVVGVVWVGTSGKTLWHCDNYLCALSTLVSVSSLESASDHLARTKNRVSDTVVLVHFCRATSALSLCTHFMRQLELVT